MILFMKKVGCVVVVVGLFAGVRVSRAENFHQAPASTLELKNPFKPGDHSTLKAGALLFETHCVQCHGQNAMGTGNVAALARGPVQSATDGEIFWFIGKGEPENGMPPSGLGETERWQLVTFIKSLGKSPIKPIATSNAAVTAESGNLTNAPPPLAPFTDFRYEKPGTFHKITSQDLPPPAPETSVGNEPEIVPRPKGVWPKVPVGFKVQLFAEKLENPRFLRTAPNGDIFVTEGMSGKVVVLRGMDSKGKVLKTEVFAKGLYLPYGIAFYPAKNPQWLYIGCIDAIIRFPYRLGDLHASASFQKIMDLPASPLGHWTRALEFNPDGTKLFVAVGSASNIDDPDVSPGEKNRADILELNPDGTDVKVYASGIRNAGGGIAVDRNTGLLWASVNERDAIGDNLPPDYITHVQRGGFYGWPWWYMGGHQDPRYPGKHPELKSKLIDPDVLLQPHHATLEIAFYNGKMFPAEYQGDIFASQHGSWNRSLRTGYELIRVPLHQTGKASGEYEDFMTGFVIDNSHVWGRPVGVTVAKDGSLLVSDDESNSIWRISTAP